MTAIRLAFVGVLVLVALFLIMGAASPQTKPGPAPGEQDNAAKKALKTTLAGKKTLPTTSSGMVTIQAVSSGKITFRSTSAGVNVVICNNPPNPCVNYHGIICCDTTLHGWSIADVTRLLKDFGPITLQITGVDTTGVDTTL